MDSTTDFKFTIEPIQIANGTGYVVRDDLLEGGTKQRAVVPFLKSLQESGYSEFVYASPFSGFAQVALACAIKHLDVKCTVFCEEVAPGKLHQFSRLAEESGATLFSCTDLADAETKATSYCSGQPTRYKLPLGFDNPGYRAQLAEKVEQLWSGVQKQFSPKNLWLPLGSGTLAQTFRQITDPDLSLHCVDVHVLKESDERIQRVRDLENCHYHSAELKFHNECSAPCPVPSNAYYDRKVYDVFVREASDGDVWWNVAR